MKRMPSSSSVRTEAQRPSKWALADMVAAPNCECPSPSAWPISCVATSRTLQGFVKKQLAQGLNETNPCVARPKVTPLTTRVPEPTWLKPPQASSPEQVGLAELYPSQLSKTTPIPASPV